MLFSSSMLEWLATVGKTLDTLPGHEDFYCYVEVRDSGDNKIGHFIDEVGVFDFYVEVK